MSHANPIDPQPTTSAKHASAGIVKVPVKHSMRKLSHMQVDRIITNSSLGTWTGGKTIQFDLKNMKVTFADKIYFRLVLQNNGATAATLQDLPWLWNAVTLYANGTENITQYMPEQDFFVRLPSIDIPKTEALASVQNWDAAPGSGTYLSHIPAVVPGNPVVGYDPIPAGGSREFYYEFNSILNNCQLPLTRDFSLPWRIEFRLAANIMVSNSNSPATGDISIETFECNVLGDELHHAEKSKLIAEHRANKHVYFGYLPQLGTLQIGPTPTGGQVRFPMTNFNGKYNQFVFGIRANSTDDERRYQYNATNGTGPDLFELTNITMYNSNGQSVWVDGLTDAIMRRIFSREYYDSRFDQYFRVYRQIFTESPVEAVEEGRLGTANIETNWRIQATTVASANTDVEFFAIGMQLFRIEIGTNRQVSVVAE